MPAPPSPMAFDHLAAFRTRPLDAQRRLPSANCCRRPKPSTHHFRNGTIGLPALPRLPGLTIPSLSVPMALMLPTRARLVEMGSHRCQYRPRTVALRILSIRTACILNEPPVTLPIEALVAIAHPHTRALAALLTHTRYMPRAPQPHQSRPINKPSPSALPDWPHHMNGRLDLTVKTLATC